MPKYDADWYEKKKDYDGPLYAPWSKVVEGRGFDPVERRKQQKDDKQ